MSKITAFGGPSAPRFQKGDADDPSFGYNPVLSALVDQVHVWQAGSCFYDELPVETNGE